MFIVGGIEITKVEGDEVREVPGARSRASLGNNCYVMRALGVMEESQQGSPLWFGINSLCCSIRDGGWEPGGGQVALQALGSGGGREVGRHP